MTTQIKIEWDDLITEIQEELGDPDGNRYSRDWVNNKANDGQYYYVKRTNYLRARAPIITKENQRIFNWPSNLLRPIRLENKDGIEITQSHSRKLQKTVGNSFRSRTSSGTSQYWYSDLSGEGQFELYPYPSTAFEKSPLEFKDGFIHAVRGGEFSGTSYLLFSINDKILQITDTPDTMLVYEVEEDHLNLLKTITIDTSANPVFSFLEGLSSQTGQFFYNKGTNIRKVDFNSGVDALHATASATVISMFPAYNANNPVPYVYFQVTGGTVKKFTADITFSEIAVTGMTSLGTYTGSVMYLDGSAPVTYVTFDTDGLWKITGNSAGTQISTDTMLGIGSTKDGTIYVLNGTDLLLYTLDPTDDSLTSTGITINASTNIWSDPGSDSFFLLNPTDSAKITEYKAGVRHGEFYYSEVATTGTTDLQNKCTHNNNFYVSASDGSAPIYRTFTEVGAIVNIDDITFDQENGALVDIIDSEDVINVSQEPGIVTIFTVDSEVAYVNYVRCPVKDELEISDPQAIVEWVKHLAKRRETDSKNLNEGLLAEKFFDKYVGREASRAGNGWSPEAGGTRTYFF